MVLTCRSFSVQATITDELYIEYDVRTATVDALWINGKQAGNRNRGSLRDGHCNGIKNKKKNRKKGKKRFSKDGRRKPIAGIPNSLLHDVPDARAHHRRTLFQCACVRFGVHLLYGIIFGGKLV